MGKDEVEGGRRRSKGMMMTIKDEDPQRMITMTIMY
jgi:hypothetical protein